jgi:hypothetical protein
VTPGSSSNGDRWAGAWSAHDPRWPAVALEHDAGDRQQQQQRPNDHSWEAHRHPPQPMGHHAAYSQPQHHNYDQRPGDDRYGGRREQPAGSGRGWRDERPLVPYDDLPPVPWQGRQGSSRDDGGAQTHDGRWAHDRHEGHEPPAPRQVRLLGLPSSASPIPVGRPSLTSILSLNRSLLRLAQRATTRTWHTATPGDPTSVRRRALRSVPASRQRITPSRTIGRRPSHRSTSSSSASTPTWKRRMSETPIALTDSPREPHGLTLCRPRSSLTSWPSRALRSKARPSSATRRQVRRAAT